MALHTTLRALRAAARTGRARAAAGLAAAAIGVPLLLAPAAAHAATGPIWGTLDTQTSTAATEAAAGVGMAMFEFNWAAYEPTQGKYSASYMTAMKAQLAAYQAAGMKVTLGLGLQDPPAWALALANGTYIDQTGTPAAGAADLVFSTAVRNAVAAYLAKINTAMPLSQFWAIRLGDAAGDGEMLYPGTGTYYAFTPSALTGTGLPAGVGKNPDPTWTPGTPGLTPAKITKWITWYVGGLDNLTGWEMTTLSNLGFGGYYETLTPGSGTRPDQLVTDENSNLPNDGTTGVGAVWQLYYANLPSTANVIAYISSVADQSGGNDLCTSTDDAQSLTNPALDAWSATRWITRIAAQYGLPVAGENPGLNLPASLDTFYTNTTSTGMMAAAVAQARSCGFTAYYWAHDVHLWDGTIPFADYAAAIGG
jgi:hypothetical protein